MGSIKIIIGIIVLVFWIVKTIMGDAKKDEEDRRSISPLPSNEQDSPYSTFTSPAFEQEAQKPVQETVKSSVLPMEGVSAISGVSSIGEITNQPQMTEEERAAHAERWRRALIDSEILKRKF